MTDARIAGAVRRTPVTWLRYAQLGIVAFVIDGYAPTVQLLAHDLDIPMGLASLHATAFGSGFIVGALVAPALARRINRARSILIGSVGIAVGLGCYLLGSSLAITLIGIGLTGIFATLVQSNAFADLSDNPLAVRARLLNEGSALSQIAGLTAPVLVGVASASVLGWRVGLAVAFVLVVGSLMVNAITLRRGPKAQTKVVEAVAGSSTSFVIVWISTILVLGIEFATALWAPVWLLQFGGVDVALATASPTCMLLGMVVSRLVLSRVASRVSQDALLIGSVMLSIVGFFALWLGPSLILGFSSLFVIGLGVGGQFPLSLARLVTASNHRADTAAAASTFALGLAIAAAPACLALVEQLLGLRAAMFMIPAFGVAAIVLVIASTFDLPRIAWLKTRGDS
ncbi:Predicted arabinose efflux permease, MFS family [Agrococcus baldri]|uniref:Predicted arabinose efflux permease, MFS family n=1 Tax=Agrococcus baldri TaxID=153730 RepID=A0AA94KYM2_9MICO|nr:MFS transporter [Agrococcus baldri]SFS00168.1 Predicted arabinose efflux permease, MFS family [Agrococcus baldri]